MNAKLRPVVVALLLFAVSATGDQNQSKLEGSWVLVDGVKELAGKQEPIPASEQGHLYLVVRPNGTFFQADNLRHSFLDQLHNKGDKYVTAKTTLEVEMSSYQPKHSQLVLAHDSGHRLTVEATLLSNGYVSYRSTVPSYGGADMTVTATLQKVEGKPWQKSDNLLATWKVADGTPFAVDVSEDGSLVVAADLAGQSVYVWDTQQNKQLRVFKGHSNDVCSVAISPDGKYVASGSRVFSGRTTDDQSLRIWSVSTGEQVGQIDAFSTVNSLQFLSDGTSLLAAGIPSNNLGKATAGIWNIETGERQANFLNLYDVKSATCLPDGQTIVCVWQGIAKGQPIGLYERDTGNEIKRLGSQMPPVDVIAVSPDGSRMMTCSQERVVREWDIEAGTELRRIPMDDTWASHIAYLPDGRVITASETDNAINVWDLSAEQRVAKLVGHRNHIRDLKVSANGKTVVTCSTDGTVKVWKVPAGGKE